MKSKIRKSLATQFLEIAININRRTKKMKYLTYLLISKTQYNIHSPYIFKLYCEIINASISKKKIGIERPQRSDKIIYKFANTFQPTNVYISSTSNTRTHTIINNALKNEHHVATPPLPLPSSIDMAIITSLEEWNTIKDKIHSKSIVIWQKQHRNKNTEQEYKTFKADNKVKVTIDMYYIAITLYLPRLHKEHYILR